MLEMACLQAYLSRLTGIVNENQCRMKGIGRRAQARLRLTSAAGSDSLPGDQIREMLKGAVIRSFGVLREKAARQLPFLQVIGNAVAADSLTAAGFVSAAAPFQVVFLFAVHRIDPCTKATKNSAQQSSTFSLQSSA